MDLKMIEGDKASSKRDCRVLRVSNQKTMRCNLLESITQVAQVHGGSVVSRCNEGGVVRMKIMVRKQEVKQMLAMMGSGKNNTHQASPSASSTLEQRLHFMRRRHLRRLDQMKGRRSSSTWRPALHSIPEEY